MNTNQGSYMILRLETTQESRWPWLRELTACTVNAESWEDQVNEKIPKYWKYLANN